MLMPEFDPGDNFPEDGLYVPPFAEVPEGFEEHEDVGTPELKLLQVLHTVREAALGTDNANGDTIRGLGALATSANRARFIWPKINTDVLAVEYEEIRWTPKEESPTSRLVDNIWVRHPVLEGDEYNVYGDDATLVPDDTFFGVTFKNGQVAMYHMRSDRSGPVAYAHPRDLSFNGSQIISLETFNGERPSVYTVTTVDERAPELTTQQMTEMLLRDSNYDQHN